MKANTKRKLKIWLAAAAVLLVVAIAAGLAYLKWGGELTPNSDQAVDESWILGQNRVNILLLGSDDKLSNTSRTDTIILASFDTVGKKISLLSIPRDTRVEIAGHGLDKVNAANQIGGVDLTKETLSNLLKVPIDYYILTNFDGFKGIVDVLGGVEIDVEQDMKYHVYDSEIDLDQGLQRLDGEKALQYVRFRHDSLGDISRTQRQQKFLTALAREMSQPKNLVKLPLLLPQLLQAVETDLSPAQLIGLGRQAEQFDLAQINTQTLPGNFATISGISYWVVDMEKTPQVVREIFAGESKELIDTDAAPAANVSPKVKPQSIDADTQPSAEPAPAADDPAAENMAIPDGETGVPDQIPAEIQQPEGEGAVEQPLPEDAPAADEPGPAETPADDQGGATGTDDAVSEPQ